MFGGKVNALWACFTPVTSVSTADFSGLICKATLKV